MRVVARARLQAEDATREGAAASQDLTGGQLGGVLKRAAAAAAGAACALSLSLSPVEAETLVRLPASTNPSIFAAQRTLVEAWTIVGDSFVDPLFNNHNWEEELRTHMMAAYNSTDGDAAYQEINRMLEDLGDVYTRRVPPEEYASFRVSSDGELQGVGMLIANEPVNGHLLVLAPIKGGPADRAGILPGDEVTSINGESMEGFTGEKAARLLRGKGGTEVRVKLVRRTEAIPGVASRPDPQPTTQFKEVRLKRERVQLSPLFYTTLPAPAAAVAGGPAAPGGPMGQQGPIGYLRLTSFSNNAADEMRTAIKDLEARGASSYILDLRGNPGGLVRAGIDIARLWLDGQPVVFNIFGRTEDGELDSQPQLVDTDGSAMTRRPLAVLVNGGSASASEILSGALHDNNRAVIVGDGNTYGKGRIQSVFELEDGSALFVTVAKYKTPMGTEIDRVGIRPDRACTLPGAPPVAAAANGPKDVFAPGLPVGIGAEEALVAQLMSDRCVLTASSVLQDKVRVASSVARVAQDFPRPSA